MIQIKSTHDMGIELWFIRGDDPPAAEMAFSSKSFQLFNKKLRHFKLSEECSAAQVSSGKCEWIKEQSLRLLLGCCCSHQLIDLHICGADDVKSFLV